MYEVREDAIDATKRGGDPEKATALAIIYLGDVLRESAAASDQIADAMRTVAAEIGGSRA